MMSTVRVRRMRRERCMRGVSSWLAAAWRPRPEVAVFEDVLVVAAEIGAGVSA